MYRSQLFRVLQGNQARSSVFEVLIARRLRFSRTMDCRLHLALRPLVEP